MKRPSTNPVARTRREIQRVHHQALMAGAVRLGQYLLPDGTCVRVTGQEHLQGLKADEPVVLMCSHWDDPGDSKVLGSHVVPALANPHTGQYRVFRPVMRRADGVAGLAENALFNAVTVSGLLIQVSTPFGKNMSQARRDELKARTAKQFPAELEDIVNEARIAVIYDQGNVRGPGPGIVRGVGARKAFSKYEGKPLLILPVGITWEPNGAKGMDPFVHFRQPLVVSGENYPDAAWAYATECEIAKNHTFTATGLAGLHIFAQREKKQVPQLFEESFKTLVSTFVDEVGHCPDLNIDQRFLEPETRGAALSDFFEWGVDHGFLTRWGAVHKVGPKANWSEDPWSREDAKKPNMVRTDPIRCNANRAQQLLGLSPVLRTAFDKAHAAAMKHTEQLIRDNPALTVPVEPEPAAPSDSERQHHVDDPLRDACRVM